MQKELTFIKEDGKWYIDLPNWIGPKNALLMVGGAHHLLEDFASKLQTDTLTFKVSTDQCLSPYSLVRRKYTIFGGAYYDYNGEGDVWLCPVTLFVFGCYPEEISFSVKTE